MKELSGLAVGQLVAVHSDDAEIEQWIGRVVSLTEKEVEVVMLEGGYTNKWKVAKKQDPINKRRHVDWTDSIPKNSIILYDFQLTSTGHLRKKTINHLKNVYEQLGVPCTD